MSFPGNESGIQLASGCTCAVGRDPEPYLVSRDRDVDEGRLRNLEVYRRVHRSDRAVVAYVHHTGKAEQKVVRSKVGGGDGQMAWSLRSSDWTSGR